MQYETYDSGGVRGLFERSDFSTALSQDFEFLGPPNRATSSKTFLSSMENSSLPVSLREKTCCLLF